MVLGGSGAVAGAGSTLSRLRYLTFFDWRRFAYIVFPGGILPALTLLMFWRQDRFSRALTVVTSVLFFFFYFTAFIALHHFVVGMVLPVVVFWRVWLRAPADPPRVEFP